MGIFKRAKKKSRKINDYQRSASCVAAGEYQDKLREAIKTLIQFDGLLIGDRNIRAIRQVRVASGDICSLAINEDGYMSLHSDAGAQIATAFDGVNISTTETTLHEDLTDTSWAK